MTTEDDAINMLESLADPSSWSESNVSHDYQPEPVAYQNFETRDDGLPPIVSGIDFPKQYELPRRKPLVENMIKCGELGILSAPSKMGKSWFLQNLAINVAEGLPFLNCETQMTNVLYLDLELSQVDAMDRMWNIALSLGLKHPPKNLHLWSLRRHCYDLELLIEVLHSRLESMDPFGLIVLEPLYMLGQSQDFDENSSGCVTRLMTTLEKIVSRDDTALLVSHHFRKNIGTDNRISMMDKSSGSGVMQRFCDLQMTLSPQSLPNHAIFEMTSRSQRSPLPFVIKVEPPVFELAENADPTAYRKYGQDSQILMTPEMMLNIIPSGESLTKAQWFSKARLQGVSEYKFDQLLTMIRQSGMVTQTKKDGVILYERTINYD